jgi:hypothetical protein
MRRQSPESAAFHAVLHLPNGKMEMGTPYLEYEKPILGFGSMLQKCYPAGS